MAKRPKLAGAVRERGNSRSLIFRYQGKQYSKAVHTKTRREAQAMLPAFVASVINGEFGHKQEAARTLANAPTVREAVEIFQRDYLRQDLDGEATRRVYGYGLGLLVQEIGDRRVGDVTTPELHSALRRLKPGRAINSLHSIHMVVSKFFSQLAEDGVIPSNPTPRFSKLNLGHNSAPSAREKSLSHGQVTALLDGCSDPSLRLWVQVMVSTGTRPGEALGLRWGDVGQGALHITGSVKRSPTRGAGRLGSTKTRGSVRAIPLGAGLAAALSAEHDRQEMALRSLSGAPANVAPLQPLLQAGDCVFPADLAERRDAPLSMEAMRSRLTRAIRRAGLPKATPHWFRHTALSAMLAGDASRPGVSAVDAARIAGHSNPGTTLRVYAHAMDSNLHRGISFSDELLSPKPSAEVAPLPRRQVTTK